MQHETVIVLDFGGQYNQLIARRVRENNVYCEIYSYKTDLSVIKAKNPKGIIFTGGPNSVYLEDSPTVDPEIFSWGVPVLGICYGQQLMIHLLGGQLSNYEKLVSDQLDGTQDAYIAQFEREYALCEAAGPEDDVILPAWTVQTVTGKPTAYEDATVWTNESMAQYFGVKSVRVGDVEEDVGARLRETHIVAFGSL